MKNIFEAMPLPNKLKKAAEEFFKEHNEEQACLITGDGNIFFSSCENLCATHMRLHRVKAWEVMRESQVPKRKRNTKQAENQSSINNN